MPHHELLTLLLYRRYKAYSILALAYYTPSAPSPNLLIRAFFRGQILTPKSKALNRPKSLNTEIPRALTFLSAEDQLAQIRRTHSTQTACVLSVPCLSA